MNPTRRSLGAPSQALSFALALALVLLLAACGGGGPEPVAGCASDPECGAGAYCLQGTCRASAAPVAGFTGPAALVSSKVMTFLATVTDADPADAVARHDWTVTLVAGACQAEPTPTTSGSLDVVFWCAGTYDLTLVATDRFGVASAPATHRLEVGQSANLPTVTASSTTASVAHRCAGLPLACSLASPLPLHASGSDPGGLPLTFSWRARAANPRVVDAAVTFDPSAVGAAPIAAISSPGTAMAGDWSFEVRAENSNGFLARSAVTIRVSNRPPAIAATPQALDHRFQGGAYLASGTLTAAATDPDGDPVEASLDYAEPAGSGCGAAFDAATGAFSVSCTRAASLIGEVSREATVIATDVNGDATQASVPIEIRNRAPAIRLASSPAATEVEVHHGVGPCLGGAGFCYRVDGSQPFTAEDPDGDPVSEAALTTLVAATAARSLGQAGAETPATFRFSTPLAFPAEFRDVDGAGPFSLRGVVRDPFGATATAEVPVRVANRPPVPRAAVPFVFADHRYDASAGEYVALFELAAFEDPDGDPLTPSGEGQGACTAFGENQVTGAVTATCRLAYSPFAGGLPPLASFVGTRPLVAMALDAWSSGSAATSATIGNRPPTTVSSTGPVTARCDFICPVPAVVGGAGGRSLAAWASMLSAPVGLGPLACPDPLEFLPVEMSVDAHVADPDGDPLLLTYSLGGRLVLTKTAVPGAALHKTTPQAPSTWTVTADDGAVGTPTAATVAITDVFCP